jgi:hypothetical protein
MWREKLESEARAKIFWGDSAESVIAHLQSQGIQNPDAATLTESFLQERDTSVKSLGRRSIMIGAPLILVPVISYLIMHQMGILLMKLLGLTVVVGLFGGWKVVKGTIMVTSPRSYPGDLSEESDAP